MFEGNEKREIRVHVSAQISSRRPHDLNAWNALVFLERFSHTFPRVHFAKKSAIFDNHLLHGRAKLTFLKQTRQNWQKSETIRCMRVTELLTVRNDH